MLQFKTKAQNLLALQGVLKSAQVLPLVITNLAQWEETKEHTLKQIKALGAKRLIVRSSSLAEDSFKTSNAGAFLSLANVSFEQLEKSILQVGRSMPSLEDEILIQPMLEDISLCGVGFSVDKDNFAPYFCIQYDTSGSTSSITDGSAKEAMSYFHFRSYEHCQDPELSGVILLIKELEGLFGCEFLDIEFAMSKGVLYCLQVRPLVMDKKHNLTLSKENLERLQKRFISFQRPSLHVLGKKAFFGVMPDWNPAEIIGLKPKRLALSLYKEIITDSIWAYQRDNYGYLHLRSHPLMHSFLGIPYIDVRLSFNSFIPKSLDKNIAQKLVDYYLARLESKPQLHDKVEFEIVFSCFDLNLPHKLQKLLDYGFNQNELKRLEFSLLELTNSILDPKKGLYLKDLKKIKKLQGLFEEIRDSNLSALDKIYWLLEECKRYGTLPFAGIARAAFVAMQMLNSLVEIGFLSPQEKHDFLHSLSTVSKKLSQKSQGLNEHNKQEFLEEFGHLRAGTYHLLSPRYDEAFDEYFELKSIPTSTKEEGIFSLDEKRKKDLDQILRENGLAINPKELFKFFKLAIEGRELAKFEFTKLLSYALVLIGKLGEYYQITKEEMEHLDIHSILNLYSSLYSTNPKEQFLAEIKRNKAEFELTKALKLPPLLTKPEEIFAFKSAQILPNFITQKTITASTARENEQDIEEKIVLIYAADPGYDYLFTKKIAGFITCYGGANSHMAIRASELGLPAAIGVGEENFNRYLQAGKLRLDCQSEQIISL